MAHSFDYMITEDDSVELHVTDSDLEQAGEEYLLVLSNEYGLKGAMMELAGRDIKQISSVVDMAETKAIQDYRGY